MHLHHQQQRTNPCRHRRTVCPSHEHLEERHLLLCESSSVTHALLPMKPMKAHASHLQIAICLLLFCTSLLLTGTTTAEDFRTFTNTKGQSIRAALVKINGDDVVLRKEDGTEYTVKAATLSAFDIDWLKTKGLVITETEMPKPIAATPAAPPASVPSKPPAPVLVIPEESKTSTLQHTMIFGLPRTDAANILSNPLLKSNPKAVLETVQGMVTEKRAALVANLSVSSKFGNRSRVEAAYGCESEVSVKADGTLNAMFAITSIRSPASPKLVGDVATKRGDTVFLGSFDESEADPRMPIRLVFVTFQ